MDDLVGRALGPYEVMDRIGAGGMATVYRGVHRALGQPRAIKILLPSLAADESLVERFRSEAKIASGLRHPNIVSIYDVGEQDGLFYLVMDLVEGESLGRLLRRQKPLDLGRAMHLLGQLASALDYAHDRGVIHRDIKASNVLIGEDDHVSLFDFGIARAAAALSRLTIPGQVVGTPEYLAPEVITGAEGDRRADFYALGILAYQILAGQLPFAGTDTMALLYAQVSKTPPSLCGIRPELPVAVEQVVMRQLAKAPEARYPTADSFVSALRSATLDASTRGPSTPPGASQPAAPEPWRPGPGGEDPASQTAPGLDDDLTTPLPPSQYRPDEESVTPRPRARPAGFDPSVVTIPPESVYRPEPVHRPEPSRARAESRVPGARSPGGRADLALQRAPAPRPLGPEPSPRRGVGLLRIAVVVLGLVVAWALASGQLDSIVGLGSVPTAAPPTQAPALASTSSGETPSAVMAAPQQIAPPVAASPAAEAVAPPVAVLPPAAASDLTPPPALPPSGQAGQAIGPIATPEPTMPVAQIAALPPPPEQQLALALAKIEGGEHSSALSLLAALKESAPNTEGLDDALYRAYLGHGQQQLEHGLLDESYAAYGEALKVRPDDPIALEGQKQVVLTKLWSTMEGAWDQDDAVASAALEEILALDPGYREANLKLYALLVAQANRLLGAGDVDSALAVLRRAHEVYPEGDEARVLIEAHTPTPTPEAAPAPAPAQNQAPAPAPKPAEQQPPGIRIPMPVPGLPDINVPLPRP